MTFRFITIYLFIYLLQLIIITPIVAVVAAVMFFLQDLAFHCLLFAEKVWSVCSIMNNITNLSRDKGVQLRLN